MSQALRYTPSLKPGLMIEDAEGKWAKYEVLAQLVAQVGALQQRLTAADEREDRRAALSNDDLIAIARTAALNSVHRYNYMPCIPEEAYAWEPHYWVIEAMRASLKPADGGKPSTCTWSEGEFSWHTGCGKEWQFTDGGLPSENGMEFCHSCGKKLVVSEDQPESEQ